MVWSLSICLRLTYRSLIFSEVTVESTVDFGDLLEEDALRLADDSAELVHLGLLSGVQLGLLPDLVGDVWVEWGALSNRQLYQQLVQQLEERVLLDPGAPGVAFALKDLCHFSYRRHLRNIFSQTVTDEFVA